MLRYSAHGVRGAGAGDQSGVRMHEVFFEPKFGIFYGYSRTSGIERDAFA